MKMSRTLSLFLALTMITLFSCKSEKYHGLIVTVTEHGAVVATEDSYKEMPDSVFVNALRMCYESAEEVEEERFGYSVAKDVYLIVGTKKAMKEAEMNPNSAISYAMNHPDEIRLYKIK